MYDRSLDTFLAVAKSGSFAKAAGHLYITHTAVIKQVNALESRLGVKLFRRSNRGIVMTRAGRCLYEEAPKLIQLSRDTVRKVQNAWLASPQTIRIGTSNLDPCSAFMGLWDKISDRCPQFQLKMIPFEHDERRFARLNEDYDFVIGPYNAEVTDPGLQFIPVGEYGFCFAMPVRHLLSRRKALSFCDLSGERLLMMGRGVSPVNDRIRGEILAHGRDVVIEDIAPCYSVSTFNRCAEEGALLLSLECWKNVHPALVSVPLLGDYRLPYGIVASSHPSEETAAFLRAVHDVSGAAVR